MGSSNQPRLREATMVITVQIIKLTNEPTFSRLNAKASRLCRVRTLQRLGCTQPFVCRTREGPPP